MIFSSLNYIASNALRALIVAALLITASAQKEVRRAEDHCYDPDIPQSILIAKQAKESVDLGNAEIFVKSQVTNESGKEAVWVYETRSIHKGSRLEKTFNGCRRQGDDE